VKTLGALLSRRKAAPDKWLDASLDGVLELVEVLKSRPVEMPGDDRLIELEAAFEGSCEAFLDGAAAKPALPFYWEELFAASTGIRRLFQLLLSYAALSRMLPTRRSFRPFLEVQGRLLANVREFLRECLGNRKYSRELLRSNQHELKELRRLCLQGIASIGGEGQNAQQALRLLGLFNELAAADAALLDCLEKVYIATSL
jgi:signal transduction histidine kinase